LKRKIFIRFYADRTHHDKEDILFRELDKRSLSDNDRRNMNELVEEHESVNEGLKGFWSERY